MDIRQDKIKRVAKTLGQVHKLYQNLSDIVDSQGVTMHKIQNNVAESGANTVAAKKEMQRALNNEKTLNDKMKQGDFSLTCLIIWFFIVVVMFFLDVQLS